jgi:riboflavin kinase/FMN adenylyltransferase
MELIRGLYNLQPRHQGCVLTIGNFDGVHYGHQAVLGQLAEKAAELNVPSVVMLFEPQPQEYFAPASAPPRLTRFREKMLTLRRYSVDRVVCLHFNEAMATMPPERFVEDILVEKLGVRYLVVGDDFRFGYQRQGDFTMLQAAGQRHGFQVVNMHTLRIDQLRVSSTLIRKALGAGDLQAAENMLGRPYSMSGRVAHGEKRGQQLGFPTANIYLHRNVAPLQGVFAVEVFGLEGEPVQGVANLGTRPTVDGTRCLLEVHLFDFNQDIYGAYVRVNFLYKLREEKRFASFDELKQQIAYDAHAAKVFFEQYHATIPNKVDND